ncbi:MAG TPA: hypothetical protein DCX07_06525 [Phycisphaerales bacterium]|nr:hypothetical protein [Phycisphaerales bacterium]
MSLKEYLESWQSPSSAYRSAPFWSWNSKLDPERLCRAIESMHAAGMGGFFMHSRYGLKTAYLSDEWFRCISACVEKARELGMKAYLYDEDRWPSGAAGGLVTRPHPEFRLRILTVTEDSAPAGEGDPLGRFEVTLDDAGRMTDYRPAGSGTPRAGAKLLRFASVAQKPYGWHNDGTYLDTMNPQAVTEFLRTTHDAYAARCGKDFGGVVPAVFTDEPNIGSAMWEGKAAEVFTGDRGQAGQLRGQNRWTPELPREFLRRRGYDLMPHLPELMFASADGEFSRVRHDYHRTLTELFVENFSRPIGEWCAKHDIALTGHYLAEETLGSQTEYVGATMPHYEHMQWPGIDILRDQDDELSTAKQCASVADQLGRERVLSELYGATGWDWPLEGHKFVGDWQYAAGVNFRCPHLTHYSLAGGAKRDYPASIFTHSPWWKHYSLVEDYFGRLSYMLTRGTPVRDVLVIHPIASAWGLFTPRPCDSKLLERLDHDLKTLIYALSNQHFDWDFGDEALLARHAKTSRGQVKVGRMRYRVVVVPSCVTLAKSTVRMLRRLVAGGGTVIFAGLRPDRVEGLPAKSLGDLFEKSRACEADAASLTAALEAVLPRRVSITENGREMDRTWAMLRVVKGGRLLFVQSHDRQAGHRVRVRVEGRAPAVLWDARSGLRTALDARAAGEGFVEFELDLPASGSALVSLGLPAGRLAKPVAARAVVESRSVGGPFAVERAEPNTLPLDYCRFRIGDEPWSDPLPTLAADKKIRARWGLGTRLGGEHQPWYLYATGAVDVRPRGRCELAHDFHVTVRPAKLLLAIESPEDFEILVNGKSAGAPSGWWVDEDIRTIDIAPLVREGDNEVLLRFDYRPDMELEDAYLVGEFGVSRRGQAATPSAMTLVTPSSRLNLGSWVGQGLDFYGGAVRYRVPLGGLRRKRGQRVRVRLPGVRCTAAVVHVGTESFALPWAPFEADITDALGKDADEIVVEVIGGRKNILGPLHTPWEKWTGPGQFNPDNSQWRKEYYLTDHGLTEPVVVEVLG